MNSYTHTATTSSLGIQSRLFPLCLAAFFGLMIVGFTGFAGSEVIHNAGHDYRHSMAFPCH